jgi:hypothetical protein
LKRLAKRKSEAEEQSGRAKRKSKAEEQSGRVTASLIRTSDRNPIFLQK